MQTTIKYDLTTQEGYNMFLEAVNPETSVVVYYYFNFFNVKLDSNSNFLVQKNILNVGEVTEISPDVFQAIFEIVNKYNI